MVNRTTANDQTQSAVTELADGRILIIWTDDSETASDPQPSAIRARMFNSDGSESVPEFLVNTTTARGQFDSSVAVMADGRFVVTWTDASRTGGDTSQNAVRTQIFDPTMFDGTTTGDTVNGGSGDDILLGRAGNDRLDGGAGSDVLNGGSGGDALDGGEGIDTVSYAGSTTSVVVGLQGWTQFAAALGDTLTAVENIIGTDFIDFIGGDHGANRLEGGLLGDALYGYGGNDALIGGAGDDNLFGMDGADTLDGGTGADTARYDWATSGVIAGLDGSNWVNFGEAAGDTYVSIEGIFGSRFADAFGGNGGGDWIYAGSGNDTVYGYSGVDWLYGEAGDICSTPAPTTISLSVVRASTC